MEVKFTFIYEDVYLIMMKLYGFIFTCTVDQILNATAENLNCLRTENISENAGMIIFRRFPGFSSVGVPHSSP
jgi:hypothetical protein